MFAIRPGDTVLNRFEVHVIARVFTLDAGELGSHRIAETTEGAHLLVDNLTNVTRIAEVMPIGARVMNPILGLGTVTRTPRPISDAIGVEVLWDNGGTATTYRSDIIDPVRVDVDGFAWKLSADGSCYIPAC